MENKIKFAIDNVKVIDENFTTGCKDEDNTDKLSDDSKKKISSDKLSNEKPLKKKISKKKNDLHLCCQSNEKDKKCIRKSDQKEFDIEKRRFSKKTCLTKPIKGFSMKSSCAPYKDCIKK